MKTDKKSKVKFFFPLPYLAFSKGSHQKKNWDESVRLTDSGGRGGHPPLA